MKAEGISSHTGSGKEVPIGEKAEFKVMALVAFNYKEQKNSKHYAHVEGILFVVHQMGPH